MVGSNQVHLNDYTRAFGRCEVKAFRSRRVGTVLPLRALGHMAQLGRRTQPKENRATRERSFTELRFASFSLRFCRTARVVKGQDERPTGALDSPPRPPGACMHFFDFVCAFFDFLLDRADAFIDGRGCLPLRERRQPATLLKVTAARSPLPARRNYVL